MYSFIQRILPWILAGILFTGGVHTGYNYATSKWEKEKYDTFISKVEATRNKQEAVNKVSQDYQQKLSELEVSTDRVITDLRESNSRLYVKLKTPSKPTGDNSGCQLNGKAELDETTARDLIRITQQGDAWIESLQETIRELQDKQHKENN